MNIGYVGVGSMGGSIALRLINKFPVSVFDTNPDAMCRLVQAGAKPTSSVGQLARECRTIFLCLPTSSHVRSVIFGPDGIASNAEPGTIIIDQTTGNPSDTRQMAKDLDQTGIDLIDCPVSGGPRGAAEGTIALMVGASPEQFQRVESILEVISPRIFHVGSVGDGHVVKIVNNMLSHAQRLLTLEIAALAAKNGVNPALLADVLEASSGSNYYLKNYFRKRILAGNFTPTFTLGLLNKDLQLASDLGNSSDVPMPISNLVREVYKMATGILGAEAQPDQVSSFIDMVAQTKVVGSGAPNQSR